MIHTTVHTLKIIEKRKMERKPQKNIMESNIWFLLHLNVIVDLFQNKW